MRWGRHGDNEEPRQQVPGRGDVSFRAYDLRAVRRPGKPVHVGPANQLRDLVAWRHGPSPLLAADLARKCKPRPIRGPSKTTRVVNPTEARARREVCRVQQVHIPRGIETALAAEANRCRGAEEGDRLAVRRPGREMSTARIGAFACTVNRRVQPEAPPLIADGDRQRIWARPREAGKALANQPAVGDDGPLEIWADGEGPLETQIDSSPNRRSKRRLWRSKA